MKRFVVVVLICCATIGAAAQIRVPGLPQVKDLPLPNIDKFLRGGSPISTTLKDARGEVPFLDHLDVQFGDLATLRNSRGTFTLKPGHWAMDLQSFCFRAGTRGPQRTDGQGYLYGEIAGPDSAVFVDMLNKFSLLRDVEQRDMQVFIWALLARTKIRQMDLKMQALAARVLTPAQIVALDSGAMDVIPPNMRQRAFNSLPAEVRAVAEAENRIRDVLYRANYTYHELETIAVLAGPEPQSGRAIPRDRWSVHPGGGYLIRFKPTGYARTRVEIAVPGHVQIRRDGKGRIVSIDFGDGRRTETDYDDSVPMFDPAPNLPVVAYAFKSIRLTRPAVNGKPSELVIRNQGWTFVTRSTAQLTPRRGIFFASYREQNLLERFMAWKERYDHYNEEYRGRYDYYRERWERNTERPGEDAIRDLEDSQHYEDGIRTVLTGSPTDRLEWIIDNQERQNRALEYATQMIASLGSSPDDEFEPSHHIALPGHSASQRLGFSGRGF